MVNVLLMSTNTMMLLGLMVALIVFLVLLTVLGIVFIVALRKRAPVIKVDMSPPAAQPAHVAQCSPNRRKRTNPNRNPRRTLRLT